MSSKIVVERNGAVTTIRINRPEVRNALDCEATRELAQAFRQFEGDPQAKVAVLCGTGNAFCAGADLKELAEGTVYEPWAGSEGGPLRRPLSKPVIAAIAGYACAGGLGVALWCDLRVVEETATFAVLSRRWGVPMSDGTTVRLPRLIGMGRALDMLLTGRKVGAAEALEMGLANRVVPEGQSRTAAEALAREIAAFPELAMLSDRRSVYEQEALTLDDAVMNEARVSREARENGATQGAGRFAAGAGRHGVMS